MHSSHDAAWFERPTRALGLDLRYVKLRSTGLVGPGSFRERVGSVECSLEQLGDGVHVLGGRRADSVRIGRIATPGGVVRWCGEDVDDSHLLLQMPNREADLVTRAPVDLLWLSVPVEGLLEPALDSTTPAPAHVRASAEHLERFRSCYETLRGAGMNGTPPEQLVVDAVGSLVKSSPALDRRDASARCFVRETRRLLEAQPDAPLTSDQLASAAGTSVRTLQRAFRAAVRMSPMAYAKALRLDSTRRQLSSDTRPVAEVAHANGFRHLGRFAGEYRRMYGESPRQTLAKTRGRTEKIA